MGAETSLFKKCIIDGEEQYKCKDYSLFTAKYDSNKFSVFLFNHNNFSFDITHWKTIRHPFIVKYYDCGLFRGKKCVVTEWVQPIKPLINELSDDLVVSGIHNIANSLSFLHSTCRLSLNNLSLDSIFVSRSENTECWKLGSLLCLSSSHSENNDFSKNLLQYHNFLGTINTLPAEDLVSTSIQLIQNVDLIHRRDAYALGLLLRQLLPDIQFSQTIESLRSESIGMRANMKTVLNDQLFKSSEFVQIKSFLTSFVSYNENEKNQFFNNLVERLRNLSDNLIVSLVTLIVNSRLIMSNSEVHNQLLPFVLIPSNDSNEEMLYQLTSGESITLKPLLNKKVFKTRIIPLICKLYCIRDLRIRLLLLQYLPNYATFISKGCLRQLIIPQILLAIKDSNDDLVALTFKAISYLVQIFGANVILGPRLKLFSNGIPKLNDLSAGIETVSAVNNNITDSLVINGTEDYQLDIHKELNSWTEEKVSNKDNTNIFSETLQTNFDNKDDIKCETNKSLSPFQNKSISKKSKRSNNFIRNDFDIKEIDFKLDDNEIDNMFSDMEPVFKFPQPLTELKTSVNSSNIFAANEDNIQELGWTDQSWDNDWDKEDN